MIASATSDIPSANQRRHGPIHEHNCVLPGRHGDPAEQVVRAIDRRLNAIDRGVPAGEVHLAQHQKARLGRVRRQRDLVRAGLGDCDLVGIGRAAQVAASAGG